MGWRERLQPATFRGFAFKVSATTVDFGRRTVDHEYPSRDLVEIEDEGRRSRVFEVQAYLIGPDHDVQSNRLQTLLEAEDAGDLVHPFMGRHRVKPVQGRRLDNLTGARNLTAFEITFIEVEESAPGPFEDDARALRDAAAGARSQASGEVESGMAVDGVPEFVRGGATSGLAAVSAVLSALTFAQDQTDNVGLFARNVAALNARAAALVTAPASLALAEFAATDSIRASAATPADAYSAYRVAYVVSASRIRGRSTLAAMANTNQDLVLAACRIGATYGAAMAVQEALWASAAALAEAQAAVLDQIDALEAAASPELYAALELLRTAFVRSLLGAEPRIQSSRTITLLRSRPALVVAYVLFDGLEREADVILASGCRDPLFVPGGVPITVLDA